jgi:hypothetical protein
MDQHDSKVLVAIGTEVGARFDRVAVRLPRAVAEAAEPRIDLAISERGRWEDDTVVVDLDIASACAAARATR